MSPIPISPVFAFSMRNKAIEPTGIAVRNITQKRGNNSIRLFVAPALIGEEALSTRLTIVAVRLSPTIEPRKIATIEPILNPFSFDMVCH